MSFENDIKSWVNLDNQVRILNERVRGLRDQRNKAGDNILKYVETENLSNATVQISDGRLKFMSTRQTAPLTLTYIKKCLTDCISSERDVESIMEYIKTSRETKIAADIKRTYT
jgi:hypothetical protein